MGYKLPVPSWEGELRECCKCHIKDNPVYAGEADERGAPIFDHRVVIDLVFIAHKKLRRDETQKGYVHMIVDARDAKVRMMCRECLQVEDDTAEVWSDFDKQRKGEPKVATGYDYYQILCGE